MADTETLKRELLAAVAAAGDEAALEALRVSALGKKGSVSELLKTLGGMTPDERKANGPLFNALRDEVTNAIAAKKAALESAGLNAKLEAEKADVTLPVRPEPRGTIHPVSQVL